MQVADILGPGSDYTEDRLWSNVMIPVDYEGAVENYRALTEQDRLTGGYARLFCDYMGIILGILPVFVTATRMLRDKRAQMQELIYSRGASSAVVMETRYAALVFMHMIPVLILSLLPTVSCITAGIEGVQLDYLAWLKYDLGWLLPMVMIVVAVGMLCTELTETALAVLVQAVWWFMSVMTGLVDRIWTDGAEYVDENALSVTIKRLRDKLGAQKYIKTVYGIGYSWVTKDE